MDLSQDDARVWLSDMANIMGSLSAFNALLLIVSATYAIRYGCHHMLHCLKHENEAIQVIILLIRRLMTLQVFMKSMLSVINAESLPFCVMCILCGSYALNRQ